MKTIQTLGVDFNKRHKWLFAAARYHGVALCGGCAAAVTKGNAGYVPKDIDLAATRESAIAFLTQINRFLLERSVHFRIYANSKNDFVPKTASAHYRITCPFWLPICLFVLPDDSFRAYRIKSGHLLQLYADIRQAAEELTEIDNKPRIACEPHEESPTEERPTEEPPARLLDDEDQEGMGTSFAVPVRIGSGGHL